MREMEQLKKRVSELMLALAQRPMATEAPGPTAPEATGQTALKANPNNEKFEDMRRHDDVVSKENAKLNIGREQFGLERRSREEFQPLYLPPTAPDAIEVTGTIATEAQETTVEVIPTDSENEDGLTVVKKKRKMKSTPPKEASEAPKRRMTETKTNETHDPAKELRRRSLQSSLEMGHCGQNYTRYCRKA